MKLLVVLAAVFLVSGCQTSGSNDPASIWFKVPPGSRLVLNQPLEIPAERAHIMLQHGSAATAADDFEVGCRFEVKNLGPRTIQPEAFVILSMSSGREWINEPHTMQFFKIIRLQSATQTDIRPMKCSYEDGPLYGQPVTVSQIQEALGNIFTFEFPE
ncbi:MAG: hypothetical protein ACC648_03920 [Thiohalobacterales bacterium]